MVDVQPHLFAVAPANLFLTSTPHLTRVKYRTMLLFFQPYCPTSWWYQDTQSSQVKQGTIANFTYYLFVLKVQNQVQNNATRI